MNLKKMSTCKGTQKVTYLERISLIKAAFKKIFFLFKMFNDQFFLVAHLNIFTDHSFATSGKYFLYNPTEIVIGTIY